MSSKLPCKHSVSMGKRTVSKAALIPENCIPDGENVCEKEVKDAEGQKKRKVQSILPKNPFNYLFG